MNRNRTTLPTLFLSIFLLPALFTTGSAQVRDVALPEMVRSSGTIFSGVVTEVRGDLDEHGEIVTYTTFRTETPLRGVLPGSVQIKQYGGVSSKGTMIVPHMRYFTEGERVLVLLYPESELGFTSPIGMGQGVWSINEAGNLTGVSRSVTEGLSIGPNSKGEMSLSQMIELIQDLSSAGM